MKNYLTILAVILSIFLMASCSQQSSRAVNINNRNSDADVTSYSNLADFLRKKTNLDIRSNGDGDNVKILVRGMSTMTSGTSPIFIVDGVNMGTSYSRANQAVDPSALHKVKVLKSLAETTIYGLQGVNGVIVVNTKQM
jgi:outer membrane cobalamin receptor